MDLFSLWQRYKLAHRPELWLGAIAVSLAVLNVSLAWIHTRNADLVAIMGLCWVIIAYSIWKRCQALPLGSKPYSTAAGCLLIAWTGYKSWVMPDYDSFIRIQPFLFCLPQRAGGFGGLSPTGRDFGPMDRSSHQHQ